MQEITYYVDDSSRSNNCEIRAGLRMLRGGFNSTPSFNFIYLSIYRVFFFWLSTKLILYYMRWKNQKQKIDEISLAVWD